MTQTLNGQAATDLQTTVADGLTVNGPAGPILLHPTIILDRTLKDAFSSTAILQSSAPNRILGSPVAVAADIHQLSAANPSFPDLVLNSNLESEREHQTRFKIDTPFRG